MYVIEVTEIYFTIILPPKELMSQQSHTLTPNLLSVQINHDEPLYK